MPIIITHTAPPVPAPTPDPVERLRSARMIPPNSGPASPPNLFTALLAGLATRPREAANQGPVLPPRAVPLYRQFAPEQLYALRDQAEAEHRAATAALAALTQPAPAEESAPVSAPEPSPASVSRVLIGG
jgi:hypothetical protein